MNVHIIDASLICEDCARERDNPLVGDAYANGGGEADTPQHCAACHLFLENPLTIDGINYVADAFINYVTDLRGDHAILKIWADFYWNDYDIGQEIADLVREIITPPIESNHRLNSSP